MRRYKHASLIVPGSLLAIGLVLRSAAAFAQAGPDHSRTTAILYDSADGLLRLEEGVGPPQSVYPNIGGPGSGASKPHLSPDGRTLAWVQFLRSSGTPAAIWLMDVDGGAKRRLVSGMSSDQPAWSPDGTRIAFTSGRRDSNRVMGDLYVIDADGDHLQRLTNNSSRDEFAAWSPDGARIAYGSLRDGNFDIYIMRSDGSDLQRITSHPATDLRPAWSPDGEWLAFSSDRHDYDGGETSSYDIYVMRPDGRDVRRLTHHPLLALRPSWSPKGDELVYQVGDEGDWEIYSVGVDGGPPRRLTNNTIYDVHPDWNTFQLDCR